MKGKYSDFWPSEPKTDPIKYLVDLHTMRYSEVKLYIPKDKRGRATTAPGKRWYVYFYYHNPATGRRDLKKTYYHGINKIYKTVKQRKIYGRRLCEAYTRLLSEGWNPLENTLPAIDGIDFSLKKITVEKAIKNALATKKNQLAVSTFLDYENRISHYLEFARSNNFDQMDSSDLTRSHVNEFLKQLKRRGLSGNSINNYKSAISAIFAEMADSKQIAYNFVSDIKKVRSKPTKNHPYTPKQITAIRKYLQQNNAYLLDFIRVMAFSFMRNREVLRLRVGGVDLENRIFTVQTKSESVEKIYITEPVYKLLSGWKLENYDRSDFLFSRNGGPGPWNANLKTKTKRFSDDFRAVKKHFGFGKEYSIYSFRHSFALNIYNNFLNQGMGDMEAMLKMLPITRHESIEALSNYLREKQKMVPKDYTGKITLDL